MLLLRLSPRQCRQEHHAPLTAQAQSCPAPQPEDDAGAVLEHKADALVLGHAAGRLGHSGLQGWSGRGASRCNRRASSMHGREQGCRRKQCPAARLLCSGATSAPAVDGVGVREVVGRLQHIVAKLVACGLGCGVGAAWVGACSPAQQRLSRMQRKVASATRGSLRPAASQPRPPFLAPAMTVSRCLIMASALSLSTPS